MKHVKMGGGPLAAHDRKSDRGQTKKGPPIAQRPFVTQFFRSYDNPHTICQNLPESAVTPAETEEGQCE
jgi:hypothetical protein